MRTTAPNALEPAKPASRRALQRNFPRQSSDETSAGTDISFDFLQGEAPSVVQAVLKSDGSPLEPTVRTSMESQFDHDFSHVRVHTDENAAMSAKAVSAKAYTVGPDVVFGANRYMPNSSQGKRLVAHELAHVVQQTKGAGATTTASATEAEAVSVATAVADGKPVSVGLSAPTGIQREPEDDKNETPGGPKVESRPRFDPEKAARSAQKMVADYQGRLVDEGGGLVEIFNRSGNLYDAQKRRGAAGELGAITDFLDFGHPDGRIVARLRILPSRKGMVSPDAHIKFTDGTEMPLELRTITSAPGIRKNAPATTVRPTVFPDEKATRGGLVDATRQREVTVTDLKNSIREKAVVAAQLNAPLQEQLPSGQSRTVAPGGGYAVIDIPFGTKVDASMIEDAMKGMKIHPNVQGILFKFRVVSDNGTTTARISYSRNATGFVGRPWDVSAGLPTQPAPPVGTSANPADKPPSAMTARAEAKVEPKSTTTAPKSTTVPGSDLNVAPKSSGEEPQFRVGDAPSAQQSGSADAEKPRIRVGEQPAASEPAPTAPATKIRIVDGRAVNTDNLVGVIGSEEPGVGIGNTQAAKKATAAPAPRTQSPPSTGNMPPATKLAEPSSKSASPAVKSTAPPQQAVIPPTISTKPPIKPTVPLSTPFGRPEDGAPHAPSASTPAANAARAGSKQRLTIAVPSQRPPESVGPSAKGEAIGGGILLVLDGIHALLEHFADKEQRSAANAAWEREWVEIQKEITRTGKGVFVYFEYTRYGESSVLVFEGIHWSSGGSDSGQPGSIRGAGQHASFSRTYVGPTQEQASITDETALDFRRKELRDTQRSYQESAERMSNETWVGRKLRERAGSHLDPKLTYDAKAHIVSAGEAIQQKRFSDATRSMDLAEKALDQMSEQFKAYMGPEKN